MKKLFLKSMADEATICARCGYCNGVCCTHRELQWESTSPRGWLSMLRELGKGSRDLDSFPEEFVERAYNCTLCGKCGQACPVNIDLRGIWLGLREKIAAGGRGPEFVKKLKETVVSERNVFGLPNEERAEWVEFMDGAPTEGYRKDGAEVLYYVGCVSSFSPAAQELPKSFARIMEIAGIDFSILGGDEWCCGFPLIVAGLKKEAEEFKHHNMERMKRLGARTVVFNCPSCYHTWKTGYNLEGIKLMHSTQLLAQLMEEGTLKVAEHNVRVTYHDPCDLGRNSGVYEEPRKVIRGIPGIELVELMHNREEGLCCGGGGDFEMLKPEMTEAISARLIKEVHRLKAEMVVVACPQCKRMELSGAEAAGLKVRVLDITELVMEAGVSGNCKGD